MEVGIVLTGIFNNHRSVEVGADGAGIVFERRQRRPNFLGVPNDGECAGVNHGGKY